VSSWLDIYGIYSISENLVLWARSELTGYAEEKCRGMMEYWKVGLRLVELRAYGSERIMGSEG
jgi:hypothetical protein